MAKEETVKTENLEARYERYKGILKDLTIMSDVFMRNVCKKLECTEYVLQVIMGKKNLRIIDQVLQKDYKNLQGRSAVNRKIEEVSENFKDEAHIIYVNSKKQDNTELGRLMHDLHCKNAGDMHSKILADRVRELKETQKGVEFMCREMEQIYSEGIESGELKKAKDTALSMAADGMKVEKIAHYLKVSASMVQKWIDESMSVVQ